MKKIFLYVFYFCVASLFLFGTVACKDSEDSKYEPTTKAGLELEKLSFVDHIFFDKSENVADGITYTEVGLKTNEDRQHFYIMEVDLNKYTIWASTHNNAPDASGFVGGMMAQHAMTVENLGKEVYTGVNGDFFTAPPRKPMGMFYMNGKPVITSIYDNHTEVIYSLKNGEVYVGSYEEANKIAKDIVHAVSGFGRLITDGEVHKDFNNLDGLGMVTHPRSAIGLSQDRKTLIILVTDGRRVDSFFAKGISMPYEALVMQSLGCYNAINLDGGGSSTLIKRVVGPDGTISFPTLNVPADGTERKIGNGILIIKK